MNRSRLKVSEFVQLTTTTLKSTSETTNRAWQLQFSGMWW